MSTHPPAAPLARGNPPPGEPGGPANLVDRLLAEQRALLPVERYAKRHSENRLPALGPVYRDLIPLGRPAAGERYAFEVDLDSCTGCKACVVACHSLNGLDPDESWRDVGLAVGHHPDGSAWQQTVTTACHHCGDPACANGCPVLAYEQDAETGVVRHLDDQCIGCSYCVMKCPYDVPKYNDRLGIVRKCDMCHGRLAAGEAPACVQACPNGAIKIRLVPSVDTAVPLHPDERLVPGAFGSAYTRPTTNYLTTRPAPAAARAADEHAVVPEHAHAPLVWMLVITQLAAGAALALALFFPAFSPTARFWTALACAALMPAGIAGAVLHLGQPLKAWRAFLGWRKSWLSREILVFGAAPPLALATAAAAGLAAWVNPGWNAVAWPLAAASALAIVAGVACSVMVYADTPRRLWSLPRTTGRFGLTVTIGAALAAAAASPAALAAGALAALAGVTAAAAFLRRHSRPGRPWDDDSRATRLMLGPLRPVTGSAFGAAGLGVLAAAASSLTGGSAGWLVALAALTTASFAERWLFFTASSAPKMPGGFTS